MSELRQRIVDAWRNGREDRACHEAVPLQALSVKVSIRCEMLPSARRNSLNRLGPSPSVLTTSTVHLSPTRASTSLTARQSSATCRLLGISDVPSCRRRLGIYLASVSNRNQGRPLMAKVKIAVIVGTTRAARFGHKPAQWIADIASQRDDMVVEVLDLREYPLPFFDEVASNAWAPSQNEVAQRWQRKVAEFDGYIFVSAEYNRGVPAVLKNALDYAYPEWNKKPAAFVGYGSVGAARAIEQLRLIAVELQMAPTRTGVHIQGADFMAVWKGGKEITELTYLQQNATDMLDQLVWWANALKAARDRPAIAAAA